MKRLIFILFVIPAFAQAQVIEFMGRYDVGRVDSINDSTFRLSGEFIDLTGSYTAMDADTGDKIVMRGYNSDGKVVYDRFKITGIDARNTLDLEVFVESDYAAGIQNMTGWPLTGSFPIGSPTSDTSKLTYRTSFYQNQIDPDYDAALDNLNLRSIFDIDEIDPVYAADSGAIKDTLTAHNTRINQRVRSVTATSPVVSSGGYTPNITIDTTKVVLFNDTLAAGKIATKKMLADSLAQKVYGTGTTNYIPKWTNSKKLGNSILYESSSKVGIGTTGPNEKLTVAGNIKFLNTAADGATNTTIGYLGGSVRSAGVDPSSFANIKIKTDPITWYKGVLTFETNGSDGTNIATPPTERMRITSDGKVGIATTSPGSTLSVDGTGGLAVGDDYATKAAPSSGAIIQGSVGIGTLGSSLIKLNISYSDNTVYSSGQRGYKWIQITNPSTTAGVYSGIEFAATGNAGTAAGGINLVQVGDGSGDLAFYNRSNTSFYERMRLTNLGKLGINTTTPSRILDVVGAAKATDTILTNKYFYGPTLRATNEIAVADGSGNELFGTWKHTGTDGCNTWAGYQAGHTVKLNGGGYSSNQGSYNTGIGFYSLYTNTSGYYNTAVGNRSLQQNNTGTSNTSIGHGSLYSNSTGFSNTAVGVRSLYNATGYRNTAIGDSAGFTITTGNTNSFLGYKSGYNASQKNDAVNSTAIGANSYTDASNQIVFGDGNVTQHRFRAGKVGIGKAADSTLDVSGAIKGTNIYATGKLKVDGTATITGNTELGGTIKIAGGSPGAGKVLTSDADGLASWATNTGAVYKGEVDGDDGIPVGGGSALIDGTGTIGWYYACSDAGTYDYGNPSGNSITLAVGDQLYYNGSVWLKIPGAGSYTLPAATASTLGGVKVGTSLQINSEVLNINDKDMGDITTSGSGSTWTLNNVNSNIGTYNTITINAKGQATAGSNTDYLDPADSTGKASRTWVIAQDTAAKVAIRAEYIGHDTLVQQYARTRDALKVSKADSNINGSYTSKKYVDDLIAGKLSTGLAFLKADSNTNGNAATKKYVDNLSTRINDSLANIYTEAQINTLLNTKQNVSDTSTKDATRYWVGQNYDKYSSWTLLTNGSNPISITSGGNFDITEGYGINIVGDYAYKPVFEVDSALLATRYWVGQQAYLTGNQTITLSGDVSGSGTTAITTAVADDSHNHVIGNVDFLQDSLTRIHDTIDNYTHKTRKINTTSPLSGGGNLSADRTLAIIADTLTSWRTKMNQWKNDSANYLHKSDTVLKVGTRYWANRIFRTMSNHDSLSTLDEKSYNSLTDKPTSWSISAITALQDSLNDRYRRKDTATVLLSRTRASHDYEPIMGTKSTGFPWWTGTQWTWLNQNYSLDGHTHNHDALINYVAAKHFYQKNIDTVKTSLSGLVKATSGVLSTITDNSSNWNTAYGWGNHAGLYSPVGHNHSGVYDNYGSWNLYIDGYFRSAAASGANVNFMAGYGLIAYAGATNLTPSYMADTAVLANRFWANQTFAPIGHNHAISDVDDLQDSLNIRPFNVGTPSAGYLVQYNTSNSIGQSSIYSDETGAVGIGISSIDSMLTVDGSIIAQHINATGKIRVADSITGPMFKITPEGGYAVKMVAGDDVEQGDIVMMDASRNGDTVIRLNDYTGNLIGVAYSDADSLDQVWVVISGIASVNLYDDSGATPGYYATATETNPHGVSSLEYLSYFISCIGTFIEKKSGSATQARIIVRPHPAFKPL